jgi:outer membrane protein assembly factor BamB
MINSLLKGDLFVEKRVARVIVIALLLGSITLVSNSAYGTCIDVNLDSSKYHQETTSYKVSTLLTNLEYPKGLWVKGDNVFLTETSGRNTIYGGKICLEKYDVLSGQKTVLVNHPNCSDAVVVANDNRIYLTSYTSSFPGENGSVSVVDPTTNTETHLLNIQIASWDMFIDSNDNIMIIGSSDLPSAKSIYLLPAEHYTNPSVLKTGLGRTWCISKSGTYTYFSDQHAIRRFNGTSGATETFMNKPVMSISFSSKYLFYADYFAGTVGRIDLNTKSDETLVSSLNGPINARYDESSNKLYFLEVGTQGGEFKDGTLKVITFTPSSPTRYPWIMFHHDLTHTGYTESPAPNTNQTLWTYATDSWVTSSPAVAGGVVYASSLSGKVYALNASANAPTRLIWSYPTGGAMFSSPAVADGMVFAGSDNCKIYALNASTGASIWNYTTGGTVESSPAVANGMVYVGSYDYKVYALNATTGRLVWNYTTGYYVLSSPAIAVGMVFIGSGDDKVYALDASTGKLVWSYSTGGFVGSSPAVVDGKVYVGSTDGKVYCLDSLTGSKIWNYTTGLYVKSSPAVANGMVYVGSYDNRTYALNATTGALVWRHTTGNYVESSPAVADGKVYVGSDDDKFYCLNASTGAYVWSCTTIARVVSSPAIADGVVFMGSSIGVYAFGTVIRFPEDYPTIQAAIDAAPSGATISVAVGVYHGSMVINKPLTILGRMGSDPIFDGGGSGIAVTLLSGSSGTTIAGIAITNYQQGILVTNSSSCKIYDDIMSTMAYSGVAIAGAKAVHNTISSNIFQGNSIAVDLAQSSANNTIYKNIISSNNVGLQLKTSGNIIYANTIYENKIAINMSSSSGNVIYWNNFINNTQLAISVSSTNSWDYGYPDGGNYWSTITDRTDTMQGPKQNIAGSDGIIDKNYTVATNNVDRYPLVQPYNPHDIGIVRVKTSKTIVGQGYKLSVSTSILNYGLYNETFTLTLYANETAIGPKIMIASKIVSLARRNSASIAIDWVSTGFAYGNYTISANVTVVQGETDTADNTLKAAAQVEVTIPGDVDGDRHVTILDVVKITSIYASKQGNPNFNPNCDIDDDGQITILDVVICTSHYAQKWP